MRDSHVVIGSRIVRRYNIITTDHWVYEVLEPNNWGGYGDHSSIMTFQGCRWGSVATRRLPADIDILRGEERYRAYDAYRALLLEECYTLILKAFPEAAAGRRSDGEISLTVEGTGWHRTKEMVGR
jgi:hypothetical protein